jgi:hypothetical protein
MVVPPHLPSNLGSATSGVDGSSEGGRISTERLPTTLVIYGVSLLQHLRKAGISPPASLEPVQADGIWCLRVTYEGKPPKGIPERWHGHRVIVQQVRPRA